MDHITLNTGTKMPSEGFGVYRVRNLSLCEEAVYNAIKTGYRLIDTAQAYANEEAVGAAAARAFSEGITARDELFITTKIWVSNMRNEDIAYESVKGSLKRLGLEYIDLLLLHQPMGDYFAAYRGAVKAYREGLVRAVGVSNFSPAVLTNFCENVELIPAVNQIEMHPYFTQENALDTMRDYGIIPQAWAPLAEGKHGIFTDPELEAIGKKYGKTIAQIVLKWNIQRGVPVIPKSVRPDRIEENLNIWDFSLSDEDMAAISAKDKGYSELADHSSPAFVKRLNNIKI